MNNKSIQYEEKRVEVDSATGEMIEVVKSSLIKVPQTPDFVMAFTEYMGFLSGISGGASKLLFGLIATVDRKNEITLNMARKKQIARDIGLKIKSIDSLIYQLKKKEVILSVDRGIYCLNPYLFGKGKWKNVNKMRMSVEFDFNNQKMIKEFETEFNEDEDELNLLDFDGENPFIKQP